jgi:DNA-binding NarL/FixJ family response regulator
MKRVRGRATRAPSPPNLRASLLRAGADDLVVFSFPHRDLPLPDSLAPVERDVVRGMLAGLSNVEIAARRGTSVRTVANQVAAIFRKLEIGSRARLVQRLLELDGHV